MTPSYSLPVNLCSRLKGFIYFPFPHTEVVPYLWPSLMSFTVPVSGLFYLSCPFWAGGAALHTTFSALCGCAEKAKWWCLICYLLLLITLPCCFHFSAPLEVLPQILRFPFWIVAANSQLAPVYKCFIRLYSSVHTTFECHLAFYHFISI